MPHFRKLILSAMFMIISLVLIGFLFSCNIKTYLLSDEASKIKEKVAALSCYGEGPLDDETNIMCEKLIIAHNGVIRQWNNLTCIRDKLPDPKDEGLSFQLDLNP